MTKKYNSFMPGDKFYYNGERFRGELGGKLGIVVARVESDVETYSVDFPDMKEENRFYRMTTRVMSQFRPSKKEDLEKASKVEVEHRRRRVSEE